MANLTQHRLKVATFVFAGLAVLAAGCETPGSEDDPIAFVWESELVTEDATSKEYLQALLRHQEARVRDVVDEFLFFAPHMDLLREHPAIQELARWNEAGAFDLFEGFGLEVVGFEPAQTPGNSSIGDPLGLRGDGQAPSDCYLCPGFPSQDSFAGFTWTESTPPNTYRTPAEMPGDDGGWIIFYFDYQPQQVGGPASYDFQMVLVGQGVVVVNPDGSSTTLHRVRDPGDHVGTVIRTERDAQGNVTSRTKDEMPEVPDKPEPEEDVKPAGEAAPKPKPTDKLDKYQPAEGVSVCPMSVDYCRRAYSKLLSSRDDLLQLIDGHVLVKEPEQDPAPRLEIRRDQLVINPDPNALESGDGRPKRLRMALPVLVLPPRPGT